MPNLTATHPRQGTRSRAHDRIIGTHRPRAHELPAQNRDLVAQYEDLRILGGGTARQARQPAEYPDREQLEKADEHERRA